MHSFEVDIKICPPKNSDVHRVEAEMNITLKGWLILMLSTALAKNHAKPAKGDTSHVTKMNIFCFSQLIMS